MFGRPFAFAWFQDIRCLVASIHIYAIRSPRARTIYQVLFDALAMLAIQAACYLPCRLTPVKVRKARLRAFKGIASGLDHA